MDNAAVAAAGPRSERFAATSSRWMGGAVVVLAAAGLVALVVTGPAGELDTVYVLLIAALLSWVVLIRPAVAVHAHGVLMRNMVRDVFVPSSKIVRCRVLQTLQVVTDDARFHGLGVTRSARSMMKEQRGPRPSLGLSLGSTAAGYRAESGHRLADQELTGGSYSEYVESRILALGEAAGPDDLEPVVAVAWESVACLAAAVVLVVLIAV